MIDNTAQVTQTTTGPPVSCSYLHVILLLYQEKLIRKSGLLWSGNLMVNTLTYPDKMLHKAFHLLKQWVEVQSFKVILAKCFQCHSVLPNA